VQEPLRGTGEDREVAVKTDRLELEMLRPTIRTEWESENITCAKQQSDDVKRGRQKPPSHWLKFLLFHVTPCGTAAGNAHIWKRTGNSQYKFVTCTIRVPHRRRLFAVGFCGHKFDLATEEVFRTLNFTSERFLNSW
jgi:hypothetical protein